MLLLLLLLPKLKEQNHWQKWKLFAFKIIKKCTATFYFLCSLFFCIYIKTCLNAYVLKDKCLIHNKHTEDSFFAVLFSTVSLSSALMLAYFIHTRFIFVRLSILFLFCVLRIKQQKSRHVEIETNKNYV
jgi:hypothetical protein